MAVESAPVTLAQYACDLNGRLQTAYELLRGQQQGQLTVRSHFIQWVKGSGSRLKASPRVRPRNNKFEYVGLYITQEVNKNHTYVIDHKRQVSTESESRLKRHIPAGCPRGRAPTFCEQLRQPTRQRMARSKEAELEPGLPLTDSSFSQLQRQKQ